MRGAGGDPLPRGAAAFRPGLPRARAGVRETRTGMARWRHPAPGLEHAMDDELITLLNSNARLLAQSAAVRLAQG